MKLQFSGTHYHGGNYRFTEPGEYEVDEAKATQLLADYPDQFTAPEGTQSESKQTESTPNLSKATRAQLEALASEVGLAVSDDLDTNKKLKDAIEAEQAKR